MSQNFYVHQDSKKNAGNTFIPDCTNNAGKKEAAVMHSITKLKHDQLIIYHYGQNQIKETTISKQTVDVQMNLPNITHLEISWNSTTDAISVTGKTGDPERGDTDVDYSLCLFKGIDLLDGTISDYVFTRAKDRNEESTVVFRSVINGTVLNYYDVSNDHP